MQLSKRGLHLQLLNMYKSMSPDKSATSSDVELVGNIRDTYAVAFLSVFEPSAREKVCHSCILSFIDSGVDFLPHLLARLLRFRKLPEACQSQYYICVATLLDRAHRLKLRLFVSRQLSRFCQIDATRHRYPVDCHTLSTT